MGGVIRRLIGMSAVLGLAAAGCSSGPTSAPTTRATTAPDAATSPGISASADGASVTIDNSALSGIGQVSIEMIEAPADALSDIEGGVTPLGRAMAVTLTGATLTDTALVSFPIPEDFDPAIFVPGIVWQAADGSWELLDSHYQPGDTVVSADTTHFSIGVPIKIDAGRIAAGIGDWVKNLVTGRSGVNNPTCGDEAAGRPQNLSVTSDLGDLIKWCFGRQDNVDVLKITNNWRAGVQVAVPKAWSVASYEGAGFDLQAIGDWMDSVSRETSASISRLVGPGQTIVLRPNDLSPIGTVDVSVEVSTVSWLWSLALTGLDLYLGVGGKILGLSGTKSAEILTGAQFVKCFTDYYGPDIDVLSPVPADSTFTTITTATRFGLDCGKDVLHDYMKSKGGILATVGSRLVGVMAALVGVVYGLVNGLFTGIRQIIDDVGQLFDSDELGGIGYDVIFQTAAPTPAPDAPTVLACTAGDLDGAVPDDIIARFSGDGVTIDGVTCAGRWMLIGYRPAGIDGLRMGLINLDTRVEVFLFGAYLESSRCITDVVPDPAQAAVLAQGFTDEGPCSNSTPNPPTPTVSLARCISLTAMYVGMTGHRDQVALFQQTLTILGYGTGGVDGYFGDNTFVAAFQESQAHMPEGGFEIGVDEQTVIDSMFQRLGIAC